MNQGAVRTFAFLIHPRTFAEVEGKYGVFRALPKSVKRFIVRRMPPVVLSRITGFKTVEGESILGHLIAVPLPADMMLSERELARKRVLQAIQKARSLGATHVGLGEFTSVVADGGEWLRGKVPDVFLTNGNALTAHMSYEGYRRSRTRFVNEKRPVIAVVGATGSIGSAVTKMIAKDDEFEHLYVVGRTASHLDDLLQTLSRYENAARISRASLHEAVHVADIVVVATSAPGALIDADVLKEKALVYDLTQPSNVSADLPNERPDVVLVDGGLVKLPKSCSYGYHLGIPHNSIFACMAETVLLSLENYGDDFCLGHVTAAHVDYIREISNKHGFEPSLVMLSNHTMH